MIGFYDYTVILTYLGFLFSLAGVKFVIGNKVKAAIICTAFALACDSCDGAVARKKKNRTKEESMFGVQIDSLCDLVSFGIVPALICYKSGMDDVFSVIVLSAYCLCCVIRLAYFNVLAIFRKEGEKTVYHGVPVVGLAAILPILFLFANCGCFKIILTAFVILAGFLYIYDFEFKKPPFKVTLILACIYAVPFIMFLIRG